MIEFECRECGDVIVIYYPKADVFECVNSKIAGHYSVKDNRQYITNEYTGSSTVFLYKCCSCDEVNGIRVRDNDDVFFKKDGDLL